MPGDPPTVDQRLRRGGIQRPVVAPARPDRPWDATADDVQPSKLPAWPFRRTPRPDERSDAPPQKPVESPARVPQRQPSADTQERPATGAVRSSQFAADRAAARYAPQAASFLVDDRRLPVVTVSMSGISIRWEGLRLPPVGSRVEGDVVPAEKIAAFGAVFEVVRVEPELRLVAGRFAPLSGSAIDRLLSWLSQLDRAAGRPGDSG